MEQQTFINLTEHDINEAISGTVIPKSNRYLRVDTAKEDVEYIDGVPVFRPVKQLQVIGNLPPKIEGTTYIVSSLTLNAIPADRTDFVSPGNAIKCRDTRKIIGCKGLRRRG